MKKNDVFDFRWDQGYHCFDGTLIVRENNKGELYLEDTYWVSGGNKVFTPDEAYEKGKLTFLCNLDEMIDIQEHETVYYNDDDIVIMRIHAGYRNRFLIKKGTQRSQAKMLQCVKQKIEDEYSKIRNAENSLRWYNETLKKIESGDLSVFI